MIPVAFWILTGVVKFRQLPPEWMIYLFTGVHRISLRWWITINRSPEFHRSNTQVHIFWPLWQSCKYFSTGATLRCMSFDRSDILVSTGVYRIPPVITGFHRFSPGLYKIPTVFCFFTGLPNPVDFSTLIIGFTVKCLRELEISPGKHISPKWNIM